MECKTVDVTQILLAVITLAGTVLTTGIAAWLKVSLARIESCVEVATKQNDRIEEAVNTLQK